MAGMTDTAFRRLVKRQGGCGLVVTEMVSSEGLVRGIDRTLEYAEYTEEERPVSIQIFGGDPDKMAAAAQIVEGMGADIVDVNMGCPVPKIAKHNAGCSLMREPAHAAAVIARDGEGGADSGHREDARRAGTTTSVNAPDAGADGRGRRRGGGRRSRPHRGAVLQRVVRLGSDRATSREASRIPVFGSGDCIEPEQIVERLRARGVGGVLVGRGVLRNPWILRAGAPISPPAARRAQITLAERGQFLLDYIDLLLQRARRRGRGLPARRAGPGRRRAAQRRRAVASAG